MFRQSSIGLVLAWLVLWPVNTHAQLSVWETYIAAGARAHQKGNYPEAEKQLKAALKEAKRYGPNDSRIATSLNDLALLYVTLGKYTEAERLHEQALTIWEKALGPDHPKVATALNNLAVLYNSQTRYGEAEPLYKRSLAIMEKALGPLHPRL
ncbi:MAG: tetratricopeptide repeat protein, partial [Alphaproteobacteria bacterium]|nr:tetratricopeptide repeat protein [Alphaproteobacteria bacterium]